VSLLVRAHGLLDGHGSPSARALIEAGVGVLEHGSYLTDAELDLMAADMIAVDGDPLADISALGRVQFVMARGALVVSPCPTQIVA
jgi:imidazolonepropionase-like amidohydrolase